MCLTIFYITLDCYIIRFQYGQGVIVGNLYTILYVWNFKLGHYAIHAICF